MGAVVMALSINGNDSLFAANRLNRPQNNIQTANERLSSGKRINRAGDDAAGLAIAAQLATQLLGSQTGSRNASDGISLVQTAEGAISELSNITQRINEIAIQSSNGTLSDDNRASLQLEVSQLQEEATRIIDTTEFNGQKILSQNGSIDLQVGGSASDKVSINTTDLNAQLVSSGFFTIDVSTANGAKDALSALDASIDSLTTSRSNFGATANRLESTIRGLANESENLAAAKSRIVDADYAVEVANRTSALIQQQGGLAALSQANLSNSIVTQLLK